MLVSTRRSTLSDKLIVTSVAGLLTYGVVKGRREGSGSSSSSGTLNGMTTGATTTAIMLAVNIPDRFSSDSIVRRINDIAQRTDTSQASGVQSLISEGASVV